MVGSRTSTSGFSRHFNIVKFPGFFASFLVYCVHQPSYLSVIFVSFFLASDRFDRTTKIRVLFFFKYCFLYCIFFVSEQWWLTDDVLSMILLVKRTEDGQCACSTVFPSYSRADWDIILLWRKDASAKSRMMWIEPCFLFVCTLITTWFFEDCKPFVRCFYSSDFLSLSHSHGAGCTHCPAYPCRNIFVRNSTQVWWSFIIRSIKYHFVFHRLVVVGLSFFQNFFSSPRNLALCLEPGKIWRRVPHFFGRRLQTSFR